MQRTSEDCAIDCKRSRSGGFEGCSNEKCDFRGFYLCTYSKEGLCTDCESERFPDRFYGCIFCRKPCKKILGKYCCCWIGFCEWIYSSITSNKPERISYDKKNFFNTMNKVVNIAKEKMEAPFPPLIFDKTDKEHPRNGYDWPGFYKGDKKWVKPNITINVTMEGDYLKEKDYESIYDELTKNGIFIHKEIQI